MLQTDLAALVEEGLEILVVVVELVLAPEHHLDRFGGTVTLSPIALVVLDIVEAVQPARDVTLGERVAFVRRNHSNHVKHPTLFDPRLDPHYFQLVGGQAVRLHQPGGWILPYRLIQGHTEGSLGSQDEEGHGMDRRQRTRREHLPLDPLLPATIHEGREIDEVAELPLVDGGLRADRQRRTHLGDDQTDLSGGDLNPGMDFNGEDRPDLPPPSGHEEGRLVARLAAEGYRVVARELLERETLVDQTDFVGADQVH